METIYQKKKTSSEVLMEYYWFYEHRDHLRDEWKEEDDKLKKHCDTLYTEFEELYRQEKQREENSKSTRIAKKLEQMKLTEELVSKIKLQKI
tara:strand:- start:245 stop:520 length:276 start_codon:yes stop_codon:yes gene_type:complete